jgi:acyl-[acyl-carrier-protein] desaturase
MLRELEPAVRFGFGRHLSASREWFPHEYVPYEVGRNYVEEPWDLENSDLSPVGEDGPGD